MYGDYYTFFGLVRTPLVRFGADEKLRDGAHTRAPVYSEMMLQISKDFSALPDVRTMTLSQIKFFYEGNRAELRVSTKRR